jgi:hypothetical protein
MKAKELSKRLTRFEGAYLSGFFMTNPAMITAMSLLFEKIYLPNQLELVIELSKRYKIETSIDKDMGMKFERIEGDKKIIENPLENLTPEQQKTAQDYLVIAHQFCMRNHELFPTVFETDLLQDNQVYNVELIEKGKKGELNKYRVSTNPLQVTTEGMHELENRLKRGSVPLIGLGEFDLITTKLKHVPDSSVAALIAMQSIEMVLPSTIGVKPGLILEAREKLSDHLPQFWSVMLKFSKEGKEIIKNAKSIEEANQECRNLVDTNIRPVLIDLNEKLIKDRKNWFYKILSPVGNSMKFLMGKPNLTNLDLLTTSMSLATNVGVDYINHKRKLNELKDEAGLTYLIKLGENIK